MSLRDSMAGLYLARSLGLRCPRLFLLGKKKLGKNSQASARLSRSGIALVEDSSSAEYSTWSGSRHGADMDSYIPKHKTQPLPQELVASWLSRHASQMMQKARGDVPRPRSRLALGLPHFASCYEQCTCEGMFGHAFHFAFNSV